MLSVPFAAIGVAIGINVTGLALSVPVWLGMIMLAGIVVNNAIVFIDYINQLRKQGLPGGHRAPPLGYGEVEIARRQAVHFPQIGEVGGSQLLTTTVGSMAWAAVRRVDLTSISDNVWGGGQPPDIKYDIPALVRAQALAIGWHVISPFRHSRVKIDRCLAAYKIKIAEITCTGNDTRSIGTMTFEAIGLVEFKTLAGRWQLGGVTL